jgi:CO dehydrogenase/acetyl-CoA synthase epsilon subunit
MRKAVHIKNISIDLYYISNNKYQVRTLPNMQAELFK